MEVSENWSSALFLLYVVPFCWFTTLLRAVVVSLCHVHNEKLHLPQYDANGRCTQAVPAPKSCTSTKTKHCKANSPNYHSPSLALSSLGTSTS